MKGKNVTGFSNSEEEAVQLTEVVPFLLEDMLKANKAYIERALIGRVMSKLTVIS